MTTVLIAYDGSEVSQTAVRQAAALFPGQPAVVMTVWEPGMAAMAVGPPDALGMSTLPDPETMATVDRVQGEHAATVAANGAELARSLGLAAQPRAVPDDVDVARTLVEVAQELGAGVIVVGSHGISGLRSRLLGSVARKLIEHADLPVLVIRSRET